MNAKRLAKPALLLRLAAGAVLAMALAVITERIAFRPLRRADPTTMMIASFTVSMLIQKLLVFASPG